MRSNAVATALAGACLTVLVPIAGAQDTLAIAGVALVDVRSGTIRPNVTIIVVGSQIAAVGPARVTAVPRGARVIDGRGRWAVPGFVDVHTHRTNKEELRRALALGVTTVHVMPPRPDTTLELELWSAAPDAPAPRIRLTQFPFTGEWPDNVFTGRWSLRRPGSPAEARREVTEIRRAGFRQLKLYFDSGRLWWTGNEAAILDPTIVKAVVSRARELDMPVLVHAPEASFARQAVRAQVSALIHGVLDSVLDVTFWREMRRSRVAWVPTIAAFVDLCDPPEYARRMLSDARLTETLSPRTIQIFTDDTVATTFVEDSIMPLARANRSAYITIIKRNTALAREHGVVIGLGSDRTPGASTHVEMELLRESGLTPAEVLAAATVGGAATLGMRDVIGTIEPGYRADIVILRANPLSDIRNARSTEIVIKGGRPFARHELLR